METAAAGGIRPLSRREFAAFQNIIRRETGIFLSDVKEALLVGRLSRRVRELGLPTFDAYHRLVEEDEAERVRMIDAICTHETHFFREPRQFDFLVERVLPALRADAEAGRRPRKVSAWSAACSTGEEPTSLAMVLLDQMPGWDVDVLATDLSTGVLERARAALYPVEKAAEIPSGLLKRFMLRGFGSQEGRMTTGAEIRAVVRFQRLNLNDEAYPLPAPFDLVFCRNVLIYFAPETKARVVERLRRHLSPRGHLFFGHAESAMGLTTRLRGVGPNVYVPDGAAA